jgi:hypothetical protein
VRTVKVALALGTAVLGAAALVFGNSVANAAGPRPRFQMPFPCGQTWTGNNPNSSAHRTPWEIDWNRGGSPRADLGDAVVAAAAGTVVTSAHQGSANGYGNLVVIDHGGGWKTYYAHLRVRTVARGARVAQGQKIGEVGNTSKPGNNISPHLHFEVRTTDRPYPRSIQPAVFDGARFGYPQQTLTSRNCGGAARNPFTPNQVCGAGFRQIDAQSLGASGTVYLLYNAANGMNCVLTLKGVRIGTRSPASAYLQVRGRQRTVDSGQFADYAGPVRAGARDRCVSWGGSVGSVRYDSPLEHCG